MAGFAGRGAAGVSGHAANEVRRRPKRLAATRWAFCRLRTWKQRVVRAEIGLPRRCVSFSRKIFAKANLFWEPCIRGSCHRRERAIPLPPRRRRERAIPLPPRRRRERVISLPPRSVASLMPLSRARPSSPPCPSVLAPVPVRPRPRARSSSPPVPVRPLPRARPSSPPCPSVLAPVPVCPRPFLQKIKKEQARLPALFLSET